MNATEHSCDFCDEFAGGISNAFYARYQDSLQNRVLLASGSFRVFPSLGQLVEGYLLLAPLQHYAALDEMPRPLVDELADVCQRVRAILSQNYGPCVSFEHGARGPAYGGCGIYHAHMHVVPVDGIPDPVEALKERFPHRNLRTLSSIKEVPNRDSPYLLYEDFNSNRYRFSVGNLQSQYMRRVLAEAMGTNDWDWRAAGREERLLATLNRLSSRFDNLRFSAEPVANEPHP
jgi:diadenosine tetraphosphate (Ap4A) HIT family hydrolase